MAYTASNELSGNDICWSGSQLRSAPTEQGISTYHEVAFGELELVRETLLLGISCCAFNLVIVVVQANDVDAGELDDLSGGSSNTAAHVEHSHVVVQTHLVSEIVLVAGNGSVEVLAVGKAAEVETLPPPILVQVGGEVVVVSCEGGILITTSLAEVRKITAAVGRGPFLPCVSPRSRLRRLCCPSA